jgi:hypothetical protein
LFSILKATVETVNAIIAATDEMRTALSNSGTVELKWNRLVKKLKWCLRKLKCKLLFWGSLLLAT